jgi:hypothetical protein
MEVRGTTVCVPWGSTLEVVRAGIGAAVSLSASNTDRQGETSAGDLNEQSTAARRD